MSMIGSPAMSMASPRMASPMMTPFANSTLSPRGHMRSPSLNPQTLRPAASFGDASGHLAVGPPAGYGHARHRSSPNASMYPPTARSAPHSPQRSPQRSPKTFAVPDFGHKSPGKTPSRSPSMSISGQQAPSLFPGLENQQHAALLADALKATQRQPMRRRAR